MKALKLVIAFLFALEFI